MNPELTEALAPFILNGTVIPHHTRPDGTEEFIIRGANPYEALTLTVHPPGAVTDYAFDYQPLQWYVWQQYYADQDQHDLRGEDFVDLEDVDALAEWLKEIVVRENSKP